METLDRSALKRIKKVLNGGSITSLKSPSERHQLLLHWNFDDGIKPLEYLTDQPDTDLGTIVLLYWLLEPGYLYEHQSDPMFTIIKKIEKNINSNSYSNKNISIDPSKDISTNLFNESDNKKILEIIPSVLIKPTPGEKVEMMNLQPEHIDKVYPLNEKDKEKLSKTIIKGIELLKEIDPQIEVTSTPEKIIEALDGYTKKRKPSERGEKSKFNRKQVMDFKVLDILFAEQLVRKDNWKWYIHERHEQVLDYRDFIIISEDKKYQFAMFDEPTKYYSTHIYSEGFDVATHFNNLLNIERYKADQIKQSFEYERKRNEEYKDTTDEELIKLLTKKAIEFWRNNPNTKERYKNLTDDQIAEEQKGFIKQNIYGSPLPSGVFEFSSYAKDSSKFEVDLA